MSHGLDSIETDDPLVPRARTKSLPDRALAAINQIVVALSSVALVAASFVLTYSVIVRYFLHISTDWQDEMSVFLIVGAVFMSGAAIQARRGHVGIEAIVTLLPARVDRVRRVAVDIASFLFCGYFSWKAWTLLHEAVVENFHSGSTWGPPLWIPYSLMAAGMTLLTLQLLLQALAALARGRAA